MEGERQNPAGLKTGATEGGETLDANGYVVATQPTPAYGGLVNATAGTACGVPLLSIYLRKSLGAFGPGGQVVLLLGR
jgi:hypothetical protein